MLNLQQEEALSAAVHKNMVLLIKEYAHTGYEQIHHSKNEDFERLWHLAFHLTENESVNLVEQ